MRALADAYSRDPVKKRSRYAQLRTALWNDRASFDAHWREIADFIMPTRTRFTASQRNQGGKRNQNIIDSTGRFALRTLASGLHAGLTSPARPWFLLTTPDPDLAEYKPVMDWLHVTTMRMQAVMATANFYTALPKVYSNLGGFGTAAMALLDDSRDVFRARTYPLGSYAFALDQRGLVNTFVHDKEMTVANIVEEFGVQPGYRDIDWSNISATVKDLWERGSYTTPIEVCWVVQPNLDYDENAIGPRMFKFASCWFEKADDKDKGNGGTFLRESGFHEFPIMCPRWEAEDDDVYGTDCPGMTALGDIKQLQGMAREKGKAIKKMVDPPMVGTPELRTQKTSILPGDITYVREPQHGFRAAHEISLNIEHLLYDIKDVRYLIQRAFYEDLFLMMATSDQMTESGQPITAREVVERHEEKLLALGPVIESSGDELLNPAVDRIYAMMERAGLVPEPPPELHGVQLKVEYTSIMAQAQKAIGIGTLDRFVASVFPVIQADPSLRHKLNGFQVIDDYQEATGVDPRVVRSNEEAQRLADAEAAQIKGMQDAQAAAQLGKAAKDASQAKMGQDTALDRLAGGASAVAQAQPDALMNAQAPMPQTVQ